LFRAKRDIGLEEKNPYGSKSVNWSHPVSFSSVFSVQKTLIQELASRDLLEFIDSKETDKLGEGDDDGDDDSD